MTEHTTTSRDDRIAFDRAGSGAAVIFVAGAGPFRAIDPETTETAELLSKRGVQTIVYDRLGRGESEVAGTIDLERELAAIAALIEVAGGKAVLCGHSSGCAISLAAAASGLPVSGLVLWEAPLGAQDGGAREWTDEVFRRADAGDLEGALMHYMKDMPPEWLEAARNSPIFAQLVANVPTLRADGEALVWTESAPHSELFAHIRVPVEVLVGEETLPEMSAAGDSIEAAIPGTVQKQIRGANHSWESEAMAAELAEFVTKVTPPSVRVEQADDPSWTSSTAAGRTGP